MIRPRLLGLCVLLAGLHCSLLAADQDHDLLRVRLSSDIRSTDPGTNRDDNTDAVVLHMVEGLVALREDASVGPLLASHVDISPDGLHYRFTLRDGVRFHNGARLTSADVLWSWKRYLNPATGWRCLPEFDGHGMTKVLAIDAPDARTVVFDLERPSGMFLATMARSDCGGSAIVHRDSVGADGRWIAPIGTGPYKLQEWKRGQYIDLVRFDGYSSLPGARDGYTGGKAALVSRLHFMVIPDAIAGKTALFSGDIDVFPEARSADIAEIRADPRSKVSTAPAMDMFALLLQTRDPLLRDVRIRRALALSIDAGELAWAVTNGLSPANASVIPRGSAYYSPAQAEGHVHDVEGAKRLLAQAGYQGQPIRLMTNKHHPESFDVAVLIQAMAAEAGIRIELEVLDWATQLDRYTRGRFQAMTFNYSARVDPAMSYEMIAGTKNTQPRKVWDDPAVQRRIAEAERTDDRGRRQSLFDALHRQMLADVPLVVLFNSTDAVGLRRDVMGFASWPLGKPRLWNVGIQ